MGTNILVLLLAALTPGDTAKSPLVLVRGEIVADQFLKAIEAPDPDTIVIGGVHRVRVRVRKTLFGSLRPRTRSLVTTIQMSHSRKGRRDIYLLVEPEGSGWRGIHWSDAEGGICISDDYAAEKGITGQVVELKKQGVVNCD